MKLTAAKLLFAGGLKTVNHQNIIAKRRYAIYIKKTKKVGYEKNLISAHNSQKKATIN